MKRLERPSLVLVAAMCGVLSAAPPAVTTSQPARQPSASRPRAEQRPQQRVHGQRIPVNRDAVLVNDGDTVTIRWSRTDQETVRILGIDAPETGDREHDIPHPQPFGSDARAFAQGALAASTRVELLRASTMDAYGRTLAYLFLDGQNYSVLVIQARLAEESVSRFGDNGFPAEAAAVMAAARAAGPLPFESPVAFRDRMRRVAEWERRRDRAR